MADIVTMPKLGFDMVEGTLVRWVIAEGEKVAKGTVLAEIETDKATVEVESNYDGIVHNHLVSQGSVVPVGQPIAVIAAPGEQVDLGQFSLEGGIKPVVSPDQIAQRTQPATAEEVLPDQGFFPGGVKTSPVARRMAEQHGVELKGIHGSGPAGRIVKKDIESYLALPSVPQPVLVPLGVEPQTQISDLVLPLNRLRAVIGRRMTQSKQQVPHFYVTHEYDVGRMMELRSQFNHLLQENERISVNDFIVKGVAQTLRQFPNLNASLVDDKIQQHGQVNIGVAVAVEGGLLTVVCREADRKSLRQIALEIRSMTERARQGKVRPEEVEGSTFTISNLGMFDVENFAAIINPPEAAILAVGTAREVAVVINGEVKPGLRMKTTISVDHRVSDGVEAARFLQALSVYIQEPLRLIL